MVWYPRMAELADALASGASLSNRVQVQVLFRGPSAFTFTVLPIILYNNRYVACQYDSMVVHPWMEDHFLQVI